MNKYKILKPIPLIIIIIVCYAVFYLFESTAQNNPLLDAVNTGIGMVGFIALILLIAYPIRMYFKKKKDSNPI